ncbi:hypothetical protein LMG28688_00811 [Paraburkholderia caffeinitolerans]|uniref:Uncharacterized protein n=1 Tax=Paraburkholderia caffeinitolerans TaxID=1723730 RepID=A0A6J5FJK4_9BURK|nr:hypothetical protein [Paraburkholderia caffeinitolerans]CAB3779344.1 hypothetical protein LMG28688_00811 [Paraburkholderia caffeinitolerans]
MKVDITENGTLTIVPGSSLEAFALKKWAQAVDWNGAHDAGLRMVVSTSECVEPPLGSVDASGERRDGMMPTWIFDRMVKALQPAWDYIQDHPDQFSARPGDDKNVILVDFFMRQVMGKRDRTRDVGVMAKAIFGAAVGEAIVEPWALAGAAYDALYAEAETRA